MATYSESDHDVLIQRLVDTLPCSECGSAYEAEDIYVIEQDLDTWTLVAFCTGCGAESLVKAYMEDALPGYLNPPDDYEIAAWREFLTQFDGDLRDLLLG
jgi:hypothetical protein